MEHVYREGVPKESENQGGGVKFVQFKRDGGVKWDLG